VACQTTRDCMHNICNYTLKKCVSVPISSKGAECTKDSECANAPVSINTDIPRIEMTPPAVASVPDKIKSFTSSFVKSATAGTVNSLVGNSKDLKTDLQTLSQKVSENILKLVK